MHRPSDDSFVTKREVAALLRSDLHSFVIRVFQTLNPGVAYSDNWHMEAIAYKLSECAAGRSTRLLINQPPRFLKSITTSVAFVAWVLGHDPSRRFICVSYSNDLALDLSRKFLKVVESSWYKALFPKFRIGRSTYADLTTTLLGGRMATSVGSTLTGLGGDIIIIDDPLKADEAMSKAAREHAQNWYSNSLVSRLDDKATGAIILVMQRLHQDDLAGHLLSSGDWRHLNLPAIAFEPTSIQLGGGQVHQRSIGDVLHPARESLADLNRIKAELGSFNFEAQYQQNPVPPQGNMIKWEWFRQYEALPRAPHTQIVQSWDTASKAGELNDYSVCTTWLKITHDVYLIDVLRQRLDYPSLRRAVVDQRWKFRVDVILIEDKGSGTSLIQDLRKDRTTNVRPIAMEPEGDKISRMAAQSACIEAGQVFIPKSAGWLAEFKLVIRRGIRTPFSG